MKRLYIPLPETEARRQIVVNLMSQQLHCLSDSELAVICDKTQGNSTYNERAAAQHLSSTV